MRNRIIESVFKFILGIAILYFTGWSFVGVGGALGAGFGAFGDQLICIRIDYTCYGVKNVYRFFDSPLFHFIGLGVGISALCTSLNNLLSTSNDGENNQ